MKYKLGDQVIPVRNGNYDTAPVRLIGEVGQVVEAQKHHLLEPFYSVEFEDGTVVQGIDEPCLQLFKV